ncbi:MAG: hypothetical protein LH470_00225 [Lysobacter sp.]|nr:hypothetical protein [Lysobacter sp.]
MAGSRRPVRYFLSMALVVAVLLWMRTQEGKQLALPLQAPSAGTVHPGSLGSAGALVTVGMETDRVLEIQGAPLGAHETRWDYGPSWIDFHCGKVVDWYSSPLRPLRVDGTDPALRDKSARLDKSIRC